MLALENVTFSWPGQTHPYNFTLSVDAGETIAISGASGSGKSTLLDLIGGFEQPISGTMSLDGKDLLPLPPEQRPVSILFQNDNLFDHLSAATNLGFALPGLSRSARTQRIESALGEVGLEGLSKRRTSNLSGGQKQRVALARTLLRNQPVLLLDEPFTGLDSTTAADMRDLVKRLTRARNWHVILVSHDLDDVTALADRTYGINDQSLTPD